MEGGIARYWRMTPERLNLLGTQCSKCEKKQIGKRPVCPDCSGTTLIRINTSNKTIYQSPKDIGISNEES